MIRPRSIWSILAGPALAIVLATFAEGQASTSPDQNSSRPSETTPRSQRERAEEELKQQERQRILGVVPNFNTSNVPDAAPLTSGQKFRLAWRSAIDPFQLVVAAGDAGISQAANDFPGYGQGAQGYGKRFGAAYADQFSGVFWSGAIFPVLLHEDPRYFRKGTGTIKHRLLYSVSTTFWARHDDGVSWGPNYANVLGNLTAGGLSNLYYPSTDRGLGLTFQRAATVTAEGVLGAFFLEFWPDISRSLHKNRTKR